MQHYNYIECNWNQSVTQQLLGQGLERLPHALLLIGAAGIGKLAFAEQLVAILLCESASPHLTACGECQACRWLAGGNHPDFRQVTPDGDEESDTDAEDKLKEKTKKRSPGMIRIDQIRELEAFVFVGSHRAGNRVVLIRDAESMNAAAANALLKILEEPPSSVYFILVSSRSKSLLPTIRSRCSVVPFGAPDTAAASAWLAAAGLEKQGKRYLDLAGGAPMRVAHWKEQGQLAPIDALVDSLIAPPSDPIGLAARWDSLLKNDSLFRMENLVEGLQRWLFDLLQERMAGVVRYHTGWPRPKGVEKLDPRAMLAAWHEIGQFRRSARHPLNQLLFLENLAAHFLRAVRPAS